jgi:signal peptidase I
MEAFQLNPEDFGRERWLLPPDFNPIEERLDSLGYCSYSGPSMDPILREGDLLEIKGYGLEPIRIGDVILFRREWSSGFVVHRVIGRSSEGLKTRGDNNLEDDPGLLDSRNVIGRVIAAWRGQRRIRVLRGRLGTIQARITGEGIGLIRAIFDILTPCYRFVSMKGLLRVLARAAEPSVIKFGDRDLRLVLWSHEIGRYREGVWLIKPPFKLIIDEASLPEVAQADDLYRCG